MSRIFEEKLSEVFGEKHPEVNVKFYDFVKGKTNCRFIGIESANKDLAGKVSGLRIDGLEEVYDDVDKVADIIWDNYIVGRGLDEEMPENLSYECMKDRLFVRAIRNSNPEFNPETTVCTSAGDISIALFYLVKKSEEGIGSILIRKGLISNLPDIEEIMKDAFENTQRLFPAKIASMTDTIQAMMKGVPREDKNLENADAVFQKDDSFYILTNDIGVNGAAFIFDPMVQKKLYDAIGKPYRVIPSSVHEVLIITDNRASDEELLAMVKDVNANEVLPEERLTDNIFKYDGSQLTAVA